MYETNLPPREENKMAGSDQTGDSAAITFKQWLENNELDDSAHKCLVESGFKSKKACSRLNSALINKHFSKQLSLGQQCLLEGVVETLQREARETSVNKPSASMAGQTGQNSPDVFAEAAPPDPRTNPVPAPAVPSSSGPSQSENGLDYNTLRRLLQPATDDPSAADVNAVSHATAGDLCNDGATGKQPNLFDPFAFYALDKDNRSKARDIRDYVMFYNDHKDSSVHTPIKVGDVEISLGTEKKTPLAKITQAQFMEGNMRILRELILKDQIGLSGALEYVGYVTKIACMAQTYPWQAILRYDAEYRRHQAALGFAWGAESPFLMHLLLGQDGTSSRTHQQQGREASHRANDRNRYDPATGKVICEKYNGRNGCNYRNCRFSHVCFTCSSTSHGEYGHRTQSSQRSTVTATSGNMASTESKNGQTNIAG